MGDKNKTNQQTTATENDAQVREQNVQPDNHNKHDVQVTESCEGHDQAPESGQTTSPQMTEPTVKSEQHSGCPCVKFEHWDELIRLEERRKMLFDDHSKVEEETEEIVRSLVSNVKVMFAMTSGPILVSGLTCNEGIVHAVMMVLIFWAGTVMSFIIAMRRLGRMSLAKEDIDKQVAELEADATQLKEKLNDAAVKIALN